MAYQKISVPSVKEAFVQDLEDKILSGELKPGDRLPPAREMCELMGVSLTIVNTGLAELAAKGFVEIRPRHGTYVTDYRLSGNPETLMVLMRYRGGKLNRQDVRSFCETRVALDPLVAELVIARASDEALTELEPMVAQLKREQGEDLQQYCIGVTDFFRRLYYLSENTLISLLYNSTVVPQQGLYATFIRKNGYEIVTEYLEEACRLITARKTEEAKAFLARSALMPIQGETSILEEQPGEGGSASAAAD